eukprot:NODE_4406_length_793_cov_50.289790_g4247_i0.p1 GENE.NODE_4406_length_793_cov_50.289790_g4247_i0~~NODE_4406_length_793_cov_50.289790_g4247_i0.p1  ORF type:complete len:213 (-),score=33.30 NODE_4406_length_793_cov_50.289790_g4247_i0:155-772(-)
MFIPCILCCGKKDGHWWFACFPSTSAVRVAGRKHPTVMSDLKVGDRVATLDPHGHLIWSPVLTFLHRDAQTSHYLWVHYAVASHTATLCISPEHMVMVPTPDGVGAVPSNQLRPGDVLCAEGGVRCVVQSIRCGTAAGQYAPLTAAGTLLVDGVWASCYVSEEYSHRQAHAAFAPLRTLTKLAPGLVRHKGGKVHWFARGLMMVG